MTEDKSWCGDEHHSKAITEQRPMCLEHPPCLQGQGLMPFMKSAVRPVQACPHGRRELMPLCDTVTLAAMYQRESGPYESGTLR